MPFRASDSRNEVLGVITFYTEREHDFSSEEIEFLQTLANQAAIAIYNAQLYQEVRTSSERLRQLSKRLVEVQEAERRQIARELHDEIGQGLTALNFSLERSRRSAGDGITAVLGQAQELVSELFVRVRNLSLDLRPSILDDLGLLPALLWHFKRFSAQTPMKVDFKHSGLEGVRFLPEIEISAYRIVQETLTNVARHAGVQDVRVWAASDHQNLRIEIEDNGAGFDPRTVMAAGKTGGLTGIRERVFHLAGKLTVDSARGMGARLLAELPLTGRAEREEENQWP
ncbi:MAG: GAF domain-containing sensor histidine kinase [Deltaproteobacteria bacterium]|nr:GAF domain-containing sensor histidine kinase [Deltaproteobacteria bacterium]